MNIFAGTFTLEQKTTTPELDFDIIQISDTSYFVMGGDEDITSIAGMIQYFEGLFGKISSHNISIDSEGEVEILMPETEGEVYECTSFSGPELHFDTILERFAGSDEAICIREGKISQYGNREVIVDFLY